MIYINIKDKKIPALGYGTWKLKGDACVSGVSKALEVGYRHIDTAQIYGNEAEVGSSIETSGIKRDEIFLTTKVWTSEFKDGDLQSSVDESLKKLKTDYVDLLLLHWPVEDEAPFSEQLKALQEVKESGKTRLIGIANFTVAQMKQVVEEIGADIVCNQVEYHPFLSQKSVLDYVLAHNMFMTAYCPVARGKVAEDSTIKEIAKKYNKTAGQVALRWLVQQKNIAAIPKAASENHIIENFNIFDFTLEDEDMEAIFNLANPDGRLINYDFSPKWDIVA